MPDKVIINLFLGPSGSGFTACGKISYVVFQYGEIQPDKDF